MKVLLWPLFVHEKSAEDLSKAVLMSNTVMPLLVLMAGEATAARPKASAVRCGDDLRARRRNVRRARDSNIGNRCAAVARIEAGGGARRTVADTAGAASRSSESCG